MFPALACLIYGAYTGWLEAFLTDQLDPVSPWKPLIWPLYGGILIGFVSLMFQSIAEFIRHWRAIRGLEPSPLEHASDDVTA